MNNIILIKPIVLRDALSDMTASQKALALDLLCGRKFLQPGADGLRYIDSGQKTHRLPQFYLYGSEAVCYYRQSLGLPDISIRDIEIEDIITDTEDFATLFDILYFLHLVHRQNQRLTHLIELDVPGIILWNEYRVLQEYVETLQDNNWNGHPVINRFNTADDDDEEPDWHEVVRKSLADIDYSLLRRKQVSTPIPEE